MSGLTRPLDSDTPQYLKKGGHRFVSLLLLRMTDYHQYYIAATTTIFFYDFLLTLPDEVSHVVRTPFHHTYWPSCERSNTLGRRGNHGVRREGRTSYGIR